MDCLELCLLVRNEILVLVIQLTLLTSWGSTSVSIEIIIINVERSWKIYSRSMFQR